MRVIEPRQFSDMKTKKKSPLARTLAIIAVCSSLGIGYIAYTNLVSNKFQHKTEIQSQSNDKSKEETETLQGQLKILTGEEFKNLYSSFAYPNTQMLHEKPKITGNNEADERIREIAEARGYKLSSVPVANIAKTGEPALSDDDLIQPNALIAWRELKAAAEGDGVMLQMTSAYRSVEAQRALFVRRMKSEGVYPESVAAGFVDDLVVNLLTRVAPPGYSRHHTGYTIDLACDGIGLDAFKTTSCYSWLSKNNYENTKKYGWVPSYPDGVSLQGPEPEPWEFIWVSTYSLYE